MNNEQQPLPAAVAIVHGEQLSAIPSALYIPPAALRVMLDSFEGPLDLLLFLVRKHQFDILDIPMTLLCQQYIAYLEKVIEKDIEMAADYLSMSALLVEIKTKMLLPRPPTEEGGEDDPRADLVRRLQEYEQIRQASQQIADLPRRERDFVSPWVVTTLPPLPQKISLQSSQLSAALIAVLMRQKLTTPYQVLPEGMSVRAMMGNLLRRLTTGIRYTFRLLVTPAQAGVTFLALLQLALEQAVILRQDEAVDELFVQVKGE